MDTKQTELAVVENKNDGMGVFDNTRSKVFCSITTETKEEKIKLYNALEECDALINDCVGTQIAIKDVYVEQKEIVDLATGEIKNKYRTILFAEDGRSFATGSYGIYNSIKKIISIFGLPTWEEPVNVEISKKPIGDGKTSLTLLLVK